METIGHYSGKFLPVHKGHVYAAIKASTMVDKLYVIVIYNKKSDAERCEYYNRKEITHYDRLSWLAHELKDFKNIIVTSMEYTESEYDWEKGTSKIREILGGRVDVAFSSEESYDQLFRKYYPEGKSIILDLQREFLPAEGHKILENPLKYWEYIPNIVRPHFVKKVLITGVESVGKSTMVRNLASYFNTVGIQEIGRDYCNKFNNQLVPEHFDDIAMKHYIAQQDALELCNKYLFVDTDAIVTQYYLDKYCGVQSPFLSEIAAKQSYNYIFFLTPSVKWVDDGYRFLKETRDKDSAYLYGQYKQDKLYTIANSDYHKRTEEIISILKD